MELTRHSEKQISNEVSLGIRDIMMQLIHSKFSCTVYGFFTLDYQVLGEVLGTIFIYVSIFFSFTDENRYKKINS